MNKELRSDCPIAASLDILGDRWTFLILRDMLLAGKSQFGEFATEEGVATNILSDRLSNLIEHGIIEKVQDQNDQRKFHYRLLKPGVELLPVIGELVAWGVKHTNVPDNPEFQSMLKEESRTQFIKHRTEELLSASGK